MYAPGLLSGRLISAIGPAPTATVGGAALAASCAVLLSGSALWHDLLGMGLCGLGWHLCFAAATLMLDSACPVRRSRQGPQG